MVAPCIIKLSTFVLIGVCLFSSWSLASPVANAVDVRRLKRSIGYGYGEGMPLTGLFDPKRSGSRGFHEGIFDEGFGGFSTLKKRSQSPASPVTMEKRRPEMTSRGIHGDAFTGGFGDFYTMKRSGSNDELLLAKLYKYLENEQLRGQDY